MLATLAGGLALAGPVEAHAELISSTPAAGSVLVEPPDQLELTFSEPVDENTAVVSLLDAQGEAIAGLGAVAVAEAGTVATVRLPSLEPGVYTASFQVVSAVDGHATAGTLAFVVDPTGLQAPPPAAPESTSPSVDAFAIGARWLALASVLVGLGSLAMWWNAGSPLLAAAGAADRRPPWLLIAASSCATLVALATYLALAARPILAVAGGPGAEPAPWFPLDVAAPFGWTQFAIAMRVAMIAALATFAVSLQRWLAAARGPAGIAAGPVEDRRSALVVTALLAVSVGAMSMAGHAASYGGPAFAAIDFVHLASVAAWLGALPAALVLGPRLARAMGSERSTALRAILQRHGRLALVAAPVTALTGIANSPIVLGESRDLVATDYGNLLLAKALLLAGALGMGAVNHLALRSRSRINMRTLVGVDLAVAALAVLVAATMVTIQPAAARRPIAVSPPSTAAHLFGTVGTSSVHAAVVLPAPGVQSYQVLVGDLETGAPPADLQKVFLTFVPPDPGLPAERVELVPAEFPGVWGATGAYTPVQGEWGLEVTLRRAGALDEAVAFELSVESPAPAEQAPPPDTGLDVPAPLGWLWTLLPPGPAVWLPALLALAGVGTAAWWSRRSAAPWLRAARVTLVGILVVAVVGAGSRALVSAANEPDASELADNPVPATPESIAAGERLYLANCAGCHGRDGEGDGPIVTVPAAGPLPDAVRSSSDGELSYRIALGIAGTSMPRFAGVLTEEERWHLVNYLRDRWGPALVDDRSGP